MAFFKSFQQNLPSVSISSILDSVSSRVDDLASAVSDVTYTVSDQLTEQVSTIISKVHEEEEEGEEREEGAGGQEVAGGRRAARRRAARETEAARAADAATKGGQQGEAAAVEGDYAPSQLEWEWRDGCWRVKRTEAELAAEERKKAEEQAWLEEKERKRRERRARRQEKEAGSQRDDESQRGNVRGEGEEEGSGERGSGASESAAAGSDKEAVAPTKKKGEAEASEEEEEEGTPEGEGGEDGEEVKEEAARADTPASPSPTKKKKSEKKKAKGSKEGSEKEKKASEKEKKKKKKETKEKKKEETKSKKKTKKKKKKAGKGGASDSEEDRDPEAQVNAQKTLSLWDTKHKQHPEQEGYSSEASSGRANNIQRIKRDSSLNELQPPPYRDENTPERLSNSGSRSRPRPGRGSSPERGSSEASVDQDTESYLNKGYEEDVPSDSTAVLGPEDGSGPRLPAAYEPEPLAKYGTLDVAFEYDSGEQWLAVTVTAATDIPAPKQASNVAWQVHLVLLPTKKQRAKTGVQKGPCPVFTETFKFSRLAQEALGDHAVRFRLYSVRRMKKEKVLGEKVLYLTKLNLQGKMALPVTLEPGSELTGCGSLVSVSRSAGALSYRSTGESCSPEILLGLIYNSATGRLSAEVIQGSHFKTTVSDKPTDTYVKLTMLDSKGKEMSKCKTGVCRGQPNPAYKESFVFQVALFQLSEVSLVVSVFCRRSSLRPREQLGWVALGLNSTGEEQQTHWDQMKEAGGQQVCHWHVLTDT